MEDINVWLQLFSEDGSVSQGKRIPAYFLDEDYKSILSEITQTIMTNLGWTECHRLIWGAGNMLFEPISSSASESEISA